MVYITVADSDKVRLIFLHRRLAADLDIYQTAIHRPKVVPGLGLGAGANPGDEGRATKFDDQYLVLESKKLQESKTFDYDYRLNSPKKKKNRRINVQ